MITFNQYPTLLNAIRLVCADNNITVRVHIGRSMVPEKWVQEFNGAEQAALYMLSEPLNMILPDDDIEELEADGNENALDAFATGECTIAEHLIARVPSADCLSRVLNEAFDGELAKLVQA